MDGQRSRKWLQLRPVLSVLCLYSCSRLNQGGAAATTGSAKIFIFLKKAAASGESKRAALSLFNDCRESLCADWATGFWKGPGVFSIHGRWSDKTRWRCARAAPANANLIFSASLEPLTPTGSCCQLHFQALLVILLLTGSFRRMFSYQAEIETHARPGVHVLVHASCRDAAGLVILIERLYFFLLSAFF